MQPSPTRQKAIDLRKKGYSYKMIMGKINVPKSTLSDWVSKIPYKPNSETLKRIEGAKLKSASTKSQQKIDQINQMHTLAIKEIGNLSKRDLWFLGIGLYLGEGCKHNEATSISNSDPDIILIAVKWFKNICGVETKNFKARLHLYPDNNESKSIEYWSLITGIPENQFSKTQIDRRTNKSNKKIGRIPYGTMHLSIKCLGNKKYGRMLHRKIAGWSNDAIKQITSNAGVV